MDFSKKIKGESMDLENMSLGYKVGLLLFGAGFWWLIGFFVGLIFGKVVD